MRSKTGASKEAEDRLLESQALIEIMLQAPIPPLPPPGLLIYEEIWLIREGNLVD